MEIIKILTTPNPELINIILIPMFFLDALISMLLFTKILDFKATKKQMKTYILLSIFCILARTFIKSYVGIIISILSSAILIYTIFKTSVMKTIIAMVLPPLIMSPVESIVVSFLKTFVSAEYIINVPLYRIITMILIYMITFLIYLCIKRFSFNIHVLSNMKRWTRSSIYLNIITAFIAVAIQIYLIYYYSSVLPAFILILSTISLAAYIFISFYNLINTTKLEVTTRDLENMKLYNKTLDLLQDNLRTFRHDFSNIVQAIGGYVHNEDIKGLSEYYEELLGDCKKVNNLSTLNPEVINNPSVFGILADKYHKADELDIKINLEIFMDLNKINMKIYEFTRVLGILLDNAIEASKECDRKLINVYMRVDNKRHKQLFIVENTYNNKNLDIVEIFNKNYTTKPGNSGLGLWQVNRILNKSKNVCLFTSKNKKFFTQQLEIFKS